MTQVIDFNQTPNTGGLLTSSQTCRAKLMCREGNSPDSHLRSLNKS